jgi:hypothetical protein
MANTAYEFGLLVVVFGGFLATNSTGVLANVGMWAMFLGFFAGLGGVLSAGLPESR